MGGQEVEWEPSLGANLQNLTGFLELLRQVQTHFNQAQRENLHLAEELDQLRKGLPMRIGTNAIRILGGRDSRRFGAVRLMVRTALVLWKEGPRGVLWRAGHRLRSFFAKRRRRNESPT